MRQRRRHDRHLPGGRELRGQRDQILGRQSAARVSLPRARECGQ
jgi:hypothetical protein